MEWVAVGLFGLFAWSAVVSTPPPLPSEKQERAEPWNKDALVMAPLSNAPTSESMEEFGSVAS